VCTALQELHALLLASDLRALEVHSGLQINQGVVLLDGFEAMSKSISTFDFANGATHCEQVIRGLGT
jgi:hypothetical protein